MKDYFSSICRLCMSNIDLTNLFQDNLELCNKITSCIDIHLDPHDKLPHMICNNCEMNIDNFYNFKLKCTEVEVKLKTVSVNLELVDDTFLESTNGDIDCLIKSENGLDNLLYEETSQIPEFNTLYAYSDISLPEDIDVENDKKHILVKCEQECDEGGSKPKKVKRKYRKKRREKNGYSTKEIEPLIKEYKSDAILPPKICEFCGQTFKTKSVLKQHLVRHTGEKAHSCEICHKKFTRKQHKEVHMRTHTGQRPFICNICGKSSSKRQDLLRHMRVHSDEKNYSCPRCNRKFKRSGDVISHMRSHTGERPYKCIPCEKSYTSHGALTKHYKTNCQNKLLIKSVKPKQDFQLKSNLVPPSQF